MALYIHLEDRFGIDTVYSTLNTLGICVDYDDENQVHKKKSIIVGIVTKIYPVYRHSGDNTKDCLVMELKKAYPKKSLMEEPRIFRFLSLGGEIVTKLLYVKLNSVVAFMNPVIFKIFNSNEPAFSIGPGPVVVWDMPNVIYPSAENNCCPHNVNPSLSGFPNELKKKSNIYRSEEIDQVASVCALLSKSGTYNCEQSQRNQRIISASNSLGSGALLTDQMKYLGKRSLSCFQERSLENEPNLCLTKAKIKIIEHSLRNKSSAGNYMCCHKSQLTRSDQQTNDKHRAKSCGHSMRGNLRNNQTDIACVRKAQRNKTEKDCESCFSEKNDCCSNLHENLMRTECTCAKTLHLDRALHGKQMSGYSHNCTLDQKKNLLKDLGTYKDRIEEWLRSQNGRIDQSAVNLQQVEGLEEPFNSITEKKNPQKLKPECQKLSGQNNFIHKRHVQYGHSNMFQSRIESPGKTRMSKKSVVDKQSEKEDNFKTSGQTPVKRKRNLFNRNGSYVFERNAASKSINENPKSFEGLGNESNSTKEKSNGINIESTKEKFKPDKSRKPRRKKQIIQSDDDTDIELIDLDSSPSESCSNQISIKSQPTSPFQPKNLNRETLTAKEFQSSGSEDDDQISLCVLGGQHKFNLDTKCFPAHSHSKFQNTDKINFCNKLELKAMNNDKSGSGGTDQGDSSSPKKGSPIKTTSERGRKSKSPIKSKTHCEKQASSEIEKNGQICDNVVSSSEVVKEKESKLSQEAELERKFMDLSQKSAESLNELFSDAGENDRENVLTKLSSPNQKLQIKAILIDIEPELNHVHPLNIVRGICHSGCKRKFSLQDMTTPEVMSNKCKNCKFIKHRICPWCSKEEGKKNNLLCLAFSFSLFVLYGLKVIRISVNGKSATRFLGDTLQRYIDLAAVSSGIISKLNKIKVCNPPENWDEVVLLELNLETKVLHGKVITKLIHTSFSDALVKNGEYIIEDVL